jgi:hypothetical protein
MSDSPTAICRFSVYLFEIPTSFPDGIPRFKWILTFIRKSKGPTKQENLEGGTKLNDLYCEPLRLIIKLQKSRECGIDTAKDK